MKRPKHRPGAGILLLLFVILLGGVAGFLVEAVGWMQGGPGRGGVDAFDHAQHQFRTAGSPGWTYAIIGAILAFLVTGAVRGTFKNVGSTVGTFFLILLGMVFGIFVGGVTFLGAWTLRAGGQLYEVPRYTVEAVLAAPVVFVAFMLIGATIGATVTAFIVHNTPVERLAGGLVGLTLGAVAGILLFALSTVALEQRGPIDYDWYLALGQAVASLSPLEFVFAGFGAVLGLVVGRYRWRFHGLVTFVSLLAIVGGYTAYTLFVTIPRVDPGTAWFAWLLFIAEVASLAMVLLYSFYTIDVSSRKSWRRGASSGPQSRYFIPKVAFQVPCYNEPPELVFDTLRTLMEVDYPKDRVVIMVLDDSTKEESAKPLEEFCKENGLMYLHRDNRKGFKAGALNNAIKHSPEDADLFAIIDADYQVEPEYLREIVGYFVDPNLGWVQTPQDYRNPHQSFLTEQYYQADAYFYRTVMPSRNEENTIIFAGTMGIVRRQALEGVGGWGEKYITEDAELSLRLLLRGYTSIYVNKTYGRGLIPPTYEGYKKQHYRWAFGGAKILKGHLHHLMFGRLTRRQAFDYFVGSVHWFEGLFIMFIAALLTVLAVTELAGAGLATHHSQEVLLIGLIPFFVLTDGLTRLHTVMRQSMRLSIFQTLRILGMWFSVKFSNSMAATKAILGFRIPFVRTPKAPSRRMGRSEAMNRAFRVTRFESSVAALMFLLLLALAVRTWINRAELTPMTLGPLFLFFWLTYYFLVFAAAPLYAYRSLVTFRPEAERGPEVRKTPPPMHGRAPTA